MQIRLRQSWLYMYLCSLLTSCLYKITMVIQPYSMHLNFLLTSTALILYCSSWTGAVNIVHGLIKLHTSLTNGYPCDFPCGALIHWGQSAAWCDSRLSWVRWEGLMGEDGTTNEWSSAIKAPTTPYLSPSCLHSQGLLSHGACFRLKRWGEGLVWKYYR